VTMMYLMIPLALAMTALAIGAFIWAVRGGQMDDLETPALRILHDDKVAERRVTACQASDAQPRQGHGGGHTADEGAGIHLQQLPAADPTEGTSDGV